MSRQSSGCWFFTCTRRVVRPVNAGITLDDHGQHRRSAARVPSLASGPALAVRPDGLAEAPGSRVSEADSPERIEPAGSKQEKLPAYAPHWLIERLRNAVVALQRMPGAEADAPATLSELCQTACLREVQRLEAQYNDGAPVPARAKRKLRTGPPIQ